MDKSPLWQMVFAAAFVAEFSKNSREQGADFALDNAETSAMEASTIADVAIEGLQAHRKSEESH